MNYQVWVRNGADTANLGSGPIKSARNWRQTARLDRAGEFSFEMSCSDPQRSVVTNKVIVKCYGLVNGVAAVLGAGIVDRIAVRVSAKGEPFLVVEGSDLTRELTYRSVGFLEMGNHTIEAPRLWWNDGSDFYALFIDLTAQANAGATSLQVRDSAGWGIGAITIPLDNGALHNTTTAAAPDGTHLTIDDAIPAGRHADSGEFVYRDPVGEYAGMVFDAAGYWVVGAEATFDTIAIGIYAGNNKDTTGDFYYWDGAAWAALTVQDWTINCAHSGIVTFTKPGDWATSAINGVTKYWVKLSYTKGVSSTVRISSVQVDTFSASTDVPADIVTFAPTGWALGGNLTTSTALAGGFSGETCLEALVRVAELTGEHFYCNSAKQVIWINTIGTDSGIRAIQATDAPATSNTGICYIADLEHVADTYEVYTRVYPYGAGDDETVLTLTDTTRTGDAGHTLSVANNYIEHVAGKAACGEIHKFLHAPDLTPPAYGYTGLNVRSIPRPAQIAAADLLYDYAETELDRHATAQNAYSLRVVGLRGLLTLGNKIKVTYRHFISGVEAVDIDADLYILATTTEISDSGLRTTDIVVSGEGWWPPTEASTLVNERRQTRAYQFHTQPRTLAPSYSRIVLPDSDGTPNPEPQLVIADANGYVRYVPMSDYIPATRGGTAGTTWQVAIGDVIAFGPEAYAVNSEHGTISFEDDTTDYLMLRGHRRDAADPAGLPNGFWRLHLYSSGTTALKVYGSATGSVGGDRLSLSNTGALTLFGELFPGTGGATQAVASWKADTASNLLLTEANHKRAIFVLAGIADNSATGVFTITTTNETGNVDGGGYICHLRALVGHGVANNSSAMAVRYWAGHFSRAFLATGTGVNSTVTEEYDDALAATSAGTRTIAAVLVEVAETSEYVQTVNFTIDLSGSSVATANVVVEVDLSWAGFTTAPTLAAV